MKRDRLLLAAAVGSLVCATAAAVAHTSSRAGDGELVAAVSTSMPTVSATSTTATPASSSTRATASTSTDDRLVVHAADQAAAEAVVRRFIAVWLTPQAQRDGQLAGVATDDFAPQVAEIPDEALPKARLDAVAATQIDGEQAYVKVRLTDGEVVEAHVVTTARGWLVAGLDEGS